MFKNLLNAAKEVAKKEAAKATKDLREEAAKRANAMISIQMDTVKRNLTSEVSKRLGGK